jgi:hypothetical protein
MNDLELVFGQPLLLYLLGVDDDQLPTTLTVSQGQVTDFLRDEIAELDSRDKFQITSAMRDMLVTYVPLADMTQANVLRTQAGGHLPQINETYDAIADDLMRLAKDIYPSYLFPQFNHYGVVLGSSSTGTLNHPANLQFMRHILGDSDLIRLFPDADQNAANDETKIQSVHSRITISSGHSGPLLLRSLSDLILKNAYERLIISGHTDITAYMSLVLSVLKEIQTLATGRQIDVPMVIALSNVKLPPDTELTARGVTLRSVTNENHLGILALTEPVTVEVVTRCPLKLLAIEPRPPMGWGDGAAAVERFRPQFEAADKAAQDHINLIRFALLLASSSPPYHASRQGMMRIFGPLDDLLMASMPNGSYSPVS